MRPDRVVVTSVAMLCRAARTTHGALYHHFPSKLDLFAAVLEELTHELASKVRQATASAEGWAQVETACDIYLEACTDPVVQAILFRDGPRVLSVDAFDAIDHGANEPLVIALLTSLGAAAVMRPVPIAIIARMLSSWSSEIELRRTAGEFMNWCARHGVLVNCSRSFEKRSRPARLPKPNANGNVDAAVVVGPSGAPASRRWQRDRPS